MELLFNLITITLLGVAIGWIFIMIFLFNIDSYIKKKEEKESLEEKCPYKIESNKE